MPDSSDGPTVLRILLGSQLRRLRESQGITARQAAYKIRARQSRRSAGSSSAAMPSARSTCSTCSRCTASTPANASSCSTLAEQSNKPGWWDSYSDILPDWFQAYVGMEEAAQSIRMYEPQFIPGLLQTEQYATAIIAAGEFPPEQAERLVELRKERQRRFREGKLKLWVVLDEAALRRPVAGTAVQLEQLRYLRKACASPNLTLQVLPCGAAAGTRRRPGSASCALPSRTCPTWSTWRT